MSMAQRQCKESGVHTGALSSQLQPPKPGQRGLEGPRALAGAHASSDSRARTTHNAQQESHQALQPLQAHGHPTIRPMVSLNDWVCIHKLAGCIGVRGSRKWLGFGLVKPDAGGAAHPPVRQGRAQLGSWGVQRRHRSQGNGSKAQQQLKDSNAPRRQPPRPGSLGLTTQQHPAPKSGLQAHGGDRACNEAVPALKQPSCVNSLGKGRQPHSANCASAGAKLSDRARGRAAVALGGGPGSAHKGKDSPVARAPAPPSLRVTDQEGAVAALKRAGPVLDDSGKRSRTEDHATGSAAAHSTGKSSGADPGSCTDSKGQQLKRRQLLVAGGTAGVAQVPAASAAAEASAPAPVVAGAAAAAVVHRPQQAAVPSSRKGGLSKGDPGGGDLGRAKPQARASPQQQQRQTPLVASCAAEALVRTRGSEGPVTAPHSAMQLLPSHTSAGSSSSDEGDTSSSSDEGDTSSSISSGHVDDTGQGTSSSSGGIDNEDGSSNSEDVTSSSSSDNDTNSSSDGSKGRAGPGVAAAEAPTTMPEAELLGGTAAGMRIDAVAPTADVVVRSTADIVVPELHKDTSSGTTSSSGSDSDTSNSSSDGSEGCTGPGAATAVLMAIPEASMLGGQAAATHVMCTATNKAVNPATDSAAPPPCEGPGRGTSTSSSSDHGTSSDGDGGIEGHAGPGVAAAVAPAVTPGACMLNGRPGAGMLEVVCGAADDAVSPAAGNAVPDQHKAGARDARVAKAASSSGRPVGRGSDDDVSRASAGGGGHDGIRDGAGGDSGRILGPCGGGGGTSSHVMGSSEDAGGRVGGGSNSSGRDRSTSDSGNCIDVAAKGVGGRRGHGAIGGDGEGTSSATSGGRVEPHGVDSTVSGQPGPTAALGHHADTRTAMAATLANLVQALGGDVNASTSASGGAVMPMPHGPAGPGEHWAQPLAGTMDQQQAPGPGPGRVLPGADPLSPLSDGREAARFTDFRVVRVTSAERREPSPASEGALTEEHMRLIDRVVALAVEACAQAAAAGNGAAAPTEEAPSHAAAARAAPPQQEALQQSGAPCTDGVGPSLPARHVAASAAGGAQPKPSPRTLQAHRRYPDAEPLPLPLPLRMLALQQGQPPQPARALGQQDMEPAEPHHHQHAHHGAGTVPAHAGEATGSDGATPAAAPHPASPQRAAKAKAQQRIRQQAERQPLWCSAPVHPPPAHVVLAAPATGCGASSFGGPGAEGEDTYGHGGGVAGAAAVAPCSGGADAGPSGDQALAGARGADVGSGGKPAPEPSPRAPAERACLEAPTLPAQVQLRSVGQAGGDRQQLRKQQQQPEEPGNHPSGGSQQALGGAAGRPASAKVSRGLLRGATEGAAAAVAAQRAVIEHAAALTAEAAAAAAQGLDYKPQWSIDLPPPKCEDFTVALPVCCGTAGGLLWLPAEGSSVRASQLSISVVGQPAPMSLGAFEVLGGRAACKKWRASIKVATDFHDVPAGEALPQALAILGLPLDFKARSGKRKQADSQEGAHQQQEQAGGADEEEPGPTQEQEQPQKLANGDKLVKQSPEQKQQMAQAADLLRSVLGANVQQQPEVAAAGAAADAGAEPVPQVPDERAEEGQGVQAAPQLAKRQRRQYHKKAQ